MQNVFERDVCSDIIMYPSTIIFTFCSYGHDGPHGLPNASRPSHHQLLTVVSTAASSGMPLQRGLPPPPPRQSSYSMPPVSHHMRQGGGPPPGPPPHHGPPPSHGGLPPPPSRPTAAALIGRPPMSHAFPGANPGAYHMIDRRGGGLHHDKRWPF